MTSPEVWPTDPDTLEDLQRRIAALNPAGWEPHPGMIVGGVFCCFGRHAPGEEGDPGWAAAVATAWRRVVDQRVVEGRAGAPYRRGLLAAREGPLLEAAVRGLEEPPDVLLVNATGRDHPRRAGLALHLGWVLDLPTVGVTHRPLVGKGSWPNDRPGATSPLIVDGDQVGVWLRVRPDVRPLAVSPGWRVGMAEAVEVVLSSVVRARTPEPIRQARRLARSARSASERPDWAR